MHDARALIAACLFTLLMQGVAAYFVHPLPDGGYADSDAYMRIERVIQLHESGDWYEQRHSIINAPYGEMTSWTRPLDVLLLPAAWIGDRLGDVKGALFAWGAVISPVLLLLSLAVLSWGTRLILSDRQFVLLAPLLLLQPVFNAIHSFGRPDHHGLMALLFIVMLAAGLRIAGPSPRSHPAWLAGAAAGVGIWVSVEALVACAWFGIFLGILWVRRGGDRFRHIVAYAAALAITLTFALAIERPPAEWGMPVNHRLSVVHWLLGFSLAVSCYWLGRLATAFDLQTWKKRLAAATIAAIVPAIIMLLVFPRFYAGPFGDLDPSIHQFVKTIAEYQPQMPTDFRQASRFLINLGPALIAITWMAGQARRRRALEDDAALLLVLGLLIYFPLALMQLRWSSYVHILALLPWALSLNSLMRMGYGIDIGGRRIPLRSLGVSAAVVGPLILGAVIAPGGGSNDQACDWRAMGRHLTAVHDGRHREKIMLTYLFLAGEMVWHSPHRVVGAPYVDSEGRRDTHAFFLATDPRAARKVIDERGVDLILTCREWKEAEHYRAQGGPDVMHSRLENDDIPEWLKPEPLPPELGSFRLFSVIR